jgi:hypothetical protein
MRTVILGSIVVGVTAFAFWLAMPVDGKARISPRMEPIVTVALVAATAVGGVLIAIGIGSMVLS